MASAASARHLPFFVNLEQVSLFALKLRLNGQIFSFLLHLYRFQRLLGCDRLITAGTPMYISL